jgi:ribulose-bisphosphate carboxylase large chain
MSSENLNHSDNQLFTWNSACDSNSYVFVTYIISTPVNGEQAAYGIAREQSVCATHLPDVVVPEDISLYCSRVVSVERIDRSYPKIASTYFLNTPVYGKSVTSEQPNTYKIVIAYPELLFGKSLTRLWNNIFGEAHRLGYLTSIILTELKFPEAIAKRFVGPRYGVPGIRQKLNVYDRPILCRSARPANGLYTDDMLKLNELVLTGGFDIIKDDELTYDSPRSPFKDRVERMMAMKRKVEDRTGEKKLYFANIVEDISISLELLDQAMEAGVDGVLVSSYAQGLSFVSEVRKRSDLLILAHNTCGDALTRSTAWGVGDMVMAQLHRAAGADLSVTPGAFCTSYQDPEFGAAFIRACQTEFGNCPPMLPIIQGGKQPEGMAGYIKDVGSVDFMIIAATWLDHHPQGIQMGAKAFRDACKK